MSLFDLPTLYTLEISYAAAKANEDLIRQYADTCNIAPDTNSLTFGFPNKEAKHAVGQVLFPYTYLKVDYGKHLAKWSDAYCTASEARVGFWVDHDLHQITCLKCEDGVICLIGPKGPIFRPEQDIKCPCGQSVSKASFDAVPTGTVLPSETQA